MNNLKAFEEYRYFKVSRNHGPVYYHDGEFIGNIANVKDSDEPFFNIPKKRYIKIQADLVRQRQDRIISDMLRNAVNNGQPNAENNDNRRLIVYNEELPMVERYIDILENHPEEITQTAYRFSENAREYYGIKLNDETELRATRGYSDNKYIEFRINNEIISNWTPTRNVQNKELDPYGEDDWSPSDIHPVIKLWEMTIDIVKREQKNEIYKQTFHL